MISKGSSPTSAQKDWWNWLGDRPCCACGSEAGNEIHHIKGAKYKLKVGGITTQVGNWMVLNLCYDCHRNPAINYCVDLHKKKFEQKFDSQRNLLLKNYEQYSKETGQEPFCPIILQTILDDR